MSVIYFWNILQDITHSPKYKITTLESESSLSFQVVTHEHEGEYQCLVSNSVGNVTKEYILRIRGKLRAEILCKPKVQLNNNPPKNRSNYGLETNIGSGTAYIIPGCNEYLSVHSESKSKKNGRHPTNDSWIQPGSRYRGLNWNNLDYSKMSIQS